jgi:hypothetical protein
MSVAPLFAPVLPPAASPARPAQGESPSDLAGLFGLLLSGTQPVQAVMAQAADPGAPAAPGLVAAPAGDCLRAVPPTLPVNQSTPFSGMVGPAAADALPAVGPLPAMPAAPIPTAVAPASAPPQLAPANSDASWLEPVFAPSVDHPRTGPAPLPSLAEPAPTPTETQGAAAPPQLPVGMAPLGTAQTGSAPAARPDLVSVALTADARAAAAPLGLPLQTGADPANPSPAAARARSVPATGARSIATQAADVRRQHAAILASTSSSPGAAGEQHATSDQAWLEPRSEAAQGPVTSADHAASDPARPPAPGRPVPPAPVFQVGLQIAKAVPGRIDRLFVQLEPAALGRVEVRLKFHRNDQVSAVIAAERPDTLDALQRDARLLERSLQQAGLRLDSDGLSFSLKREQAHQQAREEGWLAPSAGGRADLPLLAATDQAPPMHWFRGLRTLDIRV